ncbi:uncharacterized protein LOC110701371 isoform X3 [Chenopodium quinoa]|uniref:uncharacterized protein LOC110701371 isoform X3 n=1 Tax=Chenopodium quinoa TaxID=63459 RepID=UPI000B773DD9|nr:uncharacterized protein LOC110701371 isoform X3 [Chenopodium quinoa]
MDRSGGLISDMPWCIEPETLQTKFEEANNQGIQKSPNELYWEMVERYTPSIVEKLEQMVQAMRIEMKAKMQTQLAAHLAELKRRNKELMDETLSRMPNAMRTEMEAEMQTQLAAHMVEMEVEMQTKLAAHMAEMERGNKELIDEMLTRMFGVRDPNTFSTILPQH